MYELVVQSHFDAAHSLREYPGKCAQIHGHTWQVEVVLYGTQLDDTGMLIDFFDVKTFLNRICEQLDHRLINDHEYFKTYNPTAENLSRFFYEELASWVKQTYPHVLIRSVQIWESPKTSVRYIPDPSS